MKTLIFAAVLGLFFPMLATAQNPNRASDQKRSATVLKLIADWDEVYLKKNAAPLEKMLAENYISIDHDGEVTRKADEIELVKKEEYVLISVDHVEPPQVRFYGATAVVTTLAKVKQKYQGKESSFLGRATTVCVEKKDGGWEVVSWHASNVEEK